MNQDFFKIFNFDINKSKFSIGLTEYDIAKIKSYKDTTLCTDIQYNNLISKEAGYESFEQFVNIYLDILPDNIWSTLFLNYFLNYFLLLLLPSPLFISIYLLLILLKNHINFFKWGKLLLLEDKEINFKILYKNYWWILWRHTFELVPRYGKKSNLDKFDYKVDFKINNKFPNPKATLLMLKNLFIWNKIKPRRLIHFILPTIIFLLITFQDFYSLLFVLLPYILIYYYKNKKHQKWWSFGLHYSKTIWYRFKKKARHFKYYQESLFLRSKVIFFPILLSFLLFVLTTIFVILMYIDFFFNPVLVWNGYFSNSIISFFLTSSKDSFRTNFPVIIDYTIALDGLNIWLIWLTSLLAMLCSLYLIDSTKLYSFVSQLAWIYVLAFASFQFFCVPNYLWMYIYFELSLLPIFVLIVFWGSNWRKIHAAYQMVMFTFFGSIFLLIGIFMLFIKIWTFNSFDIMYVTQSDNLNNIFSLFEKKIIWIFLFIGFAVKTPLYPFHIWLPEAHSEAPTTGSVMLAGVLLKMGTYGFLRFVMPLFPVVLETYKTLIFTMCLSGILLSSLAALAQIDIKKIIAYSSIGHMGFVIIGIYNMNMNGLLGASYMMLSHGLISSALFFSIGLLYKIYGTRSIIYYNSIAHFMPRFSMCFFFFSLANMSFPGTAGFPGELLIFASMMESNFFIAILTGLGSILGGVYSIWLLTRVLYGQISPKISIYWDLKSSERKFLNFLLILIILFGLFPFILIDFFKPMCSFLVTVGKI